MQPRWQLHQLQLHSASTLVLVLARNSSSRLVVAVVTVAFQ
jgi:hypothetical protein